MTNETILNEVLNEYDEKIIALAQFLGLNLEIDFDAEDYETDEEKAKAIEEVKEELRQELDVIVVGYNNTFDYYGEEYEVLTDDEADDRWEEELQMYIDECILPEIPEFCQRYFDEEAWKRDARFDGRGHSIARYDGCENEEEVNGTWYYIYRQN
jgi:hypothetical protein